MPRHDASTGLGGFELPASLVRPAVEACRGFNTAADAVFYDVPTLCAELGAEAPFDAIDDPEGCLLLLDSTHAPRLRKFDNVEAFLRSDDPEAQTVAVATITGVGSSALGSAAMAWNVAKALRTPVLAIVPGYGVADLVLQALGGWFGFGLHDFLRTKSAVQTALAEVAPEAAKIGRKLLASTPNPEIVNGAPTFRYGSGSSDVLHALLAHRERPFRLLVGHSKGALQIGNALRPPLDPSRLEGLHVVTLGCPIAKNAPGVTYHQYLGLFDALGQINMWGHWPDQWPPTWHSTNPYLPPAMAAGHFVQEPD